LRLITRVRARQPFAGVGILDHPDPVPDDTAGIELVEDEPSTALGVAIDCRCVPSPAPRWTNVFSVEIVCDVLPNSGECMSTVRRPRDSSIWTDAVRVAKQPQ